MVRASDERGQQQRAATQQQREAEERRHEENMTALKALPDRRAGNRRRTNHAGGRGANEGRLTSFPAGETSKSSDCRGRAEPRTSVRWSLARCVAPPRPPLQLAACARPGSPRVCGVAAQQSYLRFLFWRQNARAALAGPSVGGRSDPRGAGRAADRQKIVRRKRLSLPTRRGAVRSERMALRRSSKGGKRR